ncbi:hypothetical protein HDU98_011110 [Podochytrium sp. JEL0797]|nr:hypothetical protein HDU98_011110 [Podochytrium sp. JEL0797]
MQVIAFLALAAASVYAATQTPSSQCLADAQSILTAATTCGLASGQTTMTAAQLACICTPANVALYASTVTDCASSSPALSADGQQLDSACIQANAQGAQSNAKSGAGAVVASFGAVAAIAFFL